MKKIKNMKTKLWYITSVNPQREGTGSDFYLDNLHFFKNFGFRTINTLQYGHFVMLLHELWLLCRIPYRAIIITTWVGFPRQLLVMKGFSNNVRFRLFIYAKRIKKWKYFIIPVDLPLQQFSFRLEQNIIDRQEIHERLIFNCADGFICAGVDMENYFKKDYPIKDYFKFDMYDQILPEYKQSNKQGNRTKQIAIIGNLSRMTDELNLLPKHEEIQYVFFGPNGNNVVTSKRNDFIYRGSLMGEEFINELATCDFGLILYSSYFEEYASRAIAGKVSTYVYALLPVICPSIYSSMSELVKRLDIGLVIKDLSEINVILALSQEKYRLWIVNCISERKKIQTGGHYKEALQKMGIEVA